jgi:hypothetical protein
VNSPATRSGIERLKTAVRVDHGPALDRASVAASVGARLVRSRRMANDDTSHATPASAKATAAAVGGFFFLVMAAVIVYALVAG